MANEFIIKHGFHSNGNSQITGSLDISDSLTVNGGAVGAAFPFTGDAQITGSLSLSGSQDIKDGNLTISGSSNYSIIITGSSTQNATNGSEIAIVDTTRHTTSSNGYGPKITLKAAPDDSTYGNITTINAISTTSGGVDSPPRTVINSNRPLFYNNTTTDYSGFALRIRNNTSPANRNVEHRFHLSGQSGGYAHIARSQQGTGRIFLHGLASSGIYGMMLKASKDDYLIIGPQTSTTDGDEVVRITSTAFKVTGNTEITGDITSITEITASGNVSSSAVSTASFGTYLGDGSQLTGVGGDAFPFTGDAQITGSLIVSGSGGAKFIVDNVVDIETGIFYGLGKGVPALNNGNHTNILVGNDITGKGDYGSVVIGTSAGASNSHHSQVVIGRNANSVSSYAVAVGNASEVNDFYGISIGHYAGNDSNTKGINIGGNAKGKGEKGIVISSIGDTNISPTKANTFGIYMTNASPNFEIEATGSSTLSGSSFTIEKSGSTVFSVIGSEGDLFTITDNLTTGSLFAVKDISGIPLLDVTSNSTIPDVVTVGQSNLLLDSGSLEVIGSISASGDVTGRLQRPTQEFGTNFTASAEYSGYYLRTGGNVTCSIQANALPSINSEFDFFQTSSAGNMLFETGSTSVILNSKNNNLNLAGQFSSATLKYVGNNTFDLMGDLT